MHHTLRFYAGSRGSIIKGYMFFGRWTRIPLIGRLVRKFANAYGRNMHRAFLLSPREAEELVNIATGVAVGPCDCRKAYHKCNHPSENEILLGPTRHIMLEAMPEDSREITREQAVEILRDSQRRGLMLSVVKCRGDYYAICSCCSCCCVPLRLSKQYGIGEALVRHKDIVKEYREYQLALEAEDND